jgi:uncharacterized metal-binding protein
MIVINRFEKSCSTFKEKEEKTQHVSLPRLKNKFINDHGVDINIIMVI